MADAGRGRVVALLLVVLTALTGCSVADAASDNGLPRFYDVRELVSAVAQRQRTDGTAKMSLRGEVTGGTSTLSFTGEGELQLLPDATAVKFTQIVTQAGAPAQETGFVVLPDATYLKLPPDPK